MSTNLEYRGRERQGKKVKVGGRPAKLNEKTGDRDLEQRDKKNRRDIFCDKMRNASVYQCDVKMSDSGKKVNENTYEISSIKRVSR